METLKNPRPEEIFGPEVEDMMKDAKDLPTEKIINMLRGKEPYYLHDPRDLMEVLLLRNVTFDPNESQSSSLPAIFYITVLTLILLFAFFGWKLYKSLKERERKREEKKKLKRKKKN